MSRPNSNSATPVRTHGHLDTEETNEAAWVATRGAVAGAATWGIGSAVLAGAGFLMSPVYRGLTIQFKVFLQMSGMTLGSMIEADRRLREHEAQVRHDRKLARDAAVWRRYEEEYEGIAERAAARRSAGRTAAAAPAVETGVGEGREKARVE